MLEGVTVGSEITIKEAGSETEYFTVYFLDEEVQVTEPKTALNELQRRGGYRVTRSETWKALIDDPDWRQYQ